ncbi:MAG TPA: SUMF1/EgtB/PvdO family nonheme iron enzyme [Verrucomicrobiae bacterium]|nr:SUMF1/EgtB/PvdO family nonheme iron enzyme [Verrucomicrobiae bacterium]
MALTAEACMASGGAVIGGGIGFLMAGDMSDAVGVESHPARDLAERLVSATVILPNGDGRFVDRDGKVVTLDRFRVVWCHGGDSVQRLDLASQPTAVESLRQYVGGGRGLLLSGGAAALVAPLQVDTVRMRPMKSDNDRGQAGLVPLNLWHPAFRGLDIDRGVLWMSNAMFPSFAEFRPTSSPAKGMRLARTPGGPEIPLLEYGLGDGRIVVMGWQLGRLYGDAAAAYRGNFEGLISNLVRYLGDAKAWQPLAMDGEGMPPRAGPIRAVSEAELRSVELAIRDLMETFGERYRGGSDFLKRLAALRDAQGEVLGQAQAAPSRVPAPPGLMADIARQFDALRREALLANPLLDFHRLLLVKRGANNLGLPRNYESNSSLKPTGYDNEIAVLGPAGPEGQLTTFYRPEGGRFVGDVDLHFDADRMLFSMPGSDGRWRVSEISADGSNLHELPLINEPDVDNYDACYLPDGRIVFGSTACFTGVPCINGSGHVANLYLLETGGRIRQLTVEQDHDWCPAVLNNGRVLYLRWEYTDLPHAFSRILFHMNPDGTEQMEYYGSNSYWPASMFYARPIPGHPTKVVAVVGGHHELPRMGELVIFDPARGRFEADGAVQRTPGHGRKVAPTMLDLPIAQSWPKFLHPYPLGEKYFLVSCKPSADALWGIYLVDVFDNMLLLREEPGYALLEPIPFRKTARPPAIPDKVDLVRRDAEVSIADVYAGEALRGVPRGTIRRLRLVSYQFGYQGMGAEPYSVGLDGPWDPKIVLGTVPVQEDGSARFRVPAYTPIALQPLDAEGKAVQLMRSWFTAMPGEVVSCVGCHEMQNTAPPVRKTMAGGREPDAIEPWRGPPRGFAFRREVQPVLDAHCIGCHDGKPRPDGRSIPSLIDGEPVPTLNNNSRMNQASRFSPSYYQLRRFVRTPTKESDLHLLTPWEFHADTTRLVQMLQKGHHGLTLGAEARDRLVTWIDLNAPYHGNWTDIRGTEIGPEVKHQWERRRAMRKMFANMEDDPEAIYPGATPIAIAPKLRPVASGEGVRPRGQSPGAVGGDALQRPIPARLPCVSVPLADGISVELVQIPAGDFVMGQEDGYADERPTCRVTIRSPFWMGRYEVTNEQFALFDPAHDSRLEHGDFLQFGPGERGWSLSGANQPVVRASWNEAMAFCRWLSRKTGRRFTLPSEAQWEYACRATTSTPLWYGATDVDFSAFANVSDARHQAIDDFGEPGRQLVIPPWRPADARYDDGSRVSAPVGSYRPNPWGLFDMHGNVAEWTCSDYHPYPHEDGMGSKPRGSDCKKVVRGGSWYDRPDRCRSAFRQAYPASQPVYDVGFRVICEGGGDLSHAIGD